MRDLLRIVWAAVVWTACVPLETIPGPAPSPFFRARDANRGGEPYSAWFADARDGVLYFGTSPFWHLWWQTDGDPRADLGEPGDHLIGRFDMEHGRFLTPFRVRGVESGARGSVWDVLAHSNGRIYYTTFFEEMGSVSSDGTDVRRFAGLGSGLNELYEGPDGRIYVTRYASRPADAGREGHGGLVVITPEGSLVREIEFPKRKGIFTAPKSVAVDPSSGEIWLNADLFSQDGHTDYATFRLSTTGEILGRQEAPPELQFVAFGPAGIGWFVWDDEGELWLRATRDGAEIASASLGLRDGDFVQDIKPAGEGSAALALWSGRAYLASVRGATLTLAEIRFQRPADCRPPTGRSLLYTAVVHDNEVYGTLYCGWTILHTPLPAFLLAGRPHAGAGFIGR